MVVRHIGKSKNQDQLWNVFVHERVWRDFVCVKERKRSLPPHATITSANGSTKNAEDKEDVRNGSSVDRVNEIHEGIGILGS